MNHELCSGCGACIQACPTNAISISESGTVNTDKEKCKECWLCVRECYYQARDLTGKPYTVEEVFEEVKKDEVFYRNTGGGVTLSGGEPTMQPEFCYELFEKCKNNSIHTAMETCGYTRWENLEKLLKVTDLFLYDFKLFDREKHKRWTGVDNKRIKENLERLVQAKKDIVIRIPLIPGVNDDSEEFGNILRYVKNLHSIKDIHIMPFHQVGSSKYDMVEVEYELKDLNEENQKKVEECERAAVEMGFKVSIGGAGFKKDGDSVKKNTTQKRGFLYKT